MALGNRRRLIGMRRPHLHLFVWSLALLAACGGGGGDDGRIGTPTEPADPPHPRPRNNRCVLRAVTSRWRWANRSSSRIRRTTASTSVRPARLPNTWSGCSRWARVGSRSEISRSPAIWSRPLRFRPPQLLLSRPASTQHRGSLLNFSPIPASNSCRIIGRHTGRCSLA